ncbi:efflux RND transporter periplasmic adaptor subunit [Cupriavidus sp. 30B13]|uniref:efflux RND transporter periplasmic adaptor subunit n=1 Tax=Cupriavidus sp. 30B13 TaxID=3384241 RepID=UPI003B8FA2B1
MFLNTPSLQAGACALAACVALSGCDGGAHAGAPAPSAASTDLVRAGGAIFVPAASPLRARLEIRAIAETPLQRPISIPGEIEADPARLVRIVPPLPGRVARLHVALGDAVRPGDALLTLDSAELSAARGEAGKARAAQQQARLELERQRTLLDAEIAARKDFEQARLAYAQASSDAETAAARLAQLGAGGGAPSQRQYTMRAPLAGRVIALEAAPGGYWNDTAAPAMTVADLSTVYLAANVSEKDIGAVFVGQPARIELNAYPDAPVTGQVRYVGEILDADTRTVKVRVAIDNRDGRYRPGLYAKVTLAGQAQPALLVPPSALLQGGLETRVLVETAPYRFVPRVVATGAQAGGMVEIRSGLAAGERIVVKNGVLLHD